jgi:hypothetical protein
VKRLLGQASGFRTGAVSFTRCHYLISSDGDRGSFGLPTIAYFLGISVRMFFNGRDPPHIYVIYQGYEALVAI